MSVKKKYQRTEKAQALLDKVETPKYDRQIIIGLKKFFNKTAPEDMQSFYSETELANLVQLQGTERDVEARMPVKMT